MGWLASSADQLGYLLFQTHTASFTFFIGFYSSSIGQSSTAVS